MRYLLVPKGMLAHPEGTQVLDADALDRIVKAAKRMGRDIPVDFDHATFHVNNAPLAGHVIFNSLSAEPDGIYGDIQFTPSAQALVREGKFRHLSPALAYNPRLSRGDRLHMERIVSMGLTNHPNMQAMGPLFNNTAKEEIMKELLAQMKIALGLPPETDDTQVLTRALEKFQQTPAEPEPADAQAPTREEFTALTQELAALKKKLSDDMVNGAIASGKVVPAQRAWAADYAAKDPEGFRQYLANSRPVNMGRIVTGPVSPAAQKMPLDPEQERMNSLLGISREVFDKYTTKK